MFVPPLVQNPLYGVFFCAEAILTGIQVLAQEADVLLTGVSKWLGFRLGVRGLGARFSAGCTGAWS
jgi:hypothetical protein